MATIKLITKGSKSTSTLYIRFVNGRTCDISISTNLSANPAYWDNKKSNYRNVNSIPGLASKKAKLEKLKIFILEAFNEAFLKGDVIDKNWLSNTYRLFCNRPVQESKLSTQNQFVYYADFANWWIKNKAPEWKTSKNKTASDKVVAQYECFVKIWSDFEAGNQYKIQEVGSDLLDKFTSYMSLHNYAESTTKRQLARAKFFIARAKTENLKIDNTYTDRVFVDKVDENITHPYLNESEIQAIYKLDLSHDVVLDNVRDSLIIGLWTGLRISDFNRNLDISNIEGDYISIKTQKTGAWVKIPLHPQVQDVIQKRFGNLPQKTSDKHFNQKIKTICMLAEIDQDTKGGVVQVDSKTKAKRKVYGVYKKYELVSSHTCRRSFVSNLFGHISNKDLMSIAGWSNEKMMLHYVKRTKTESADNLKEYWESKYQN